MTLNTGNDLKSKEFQQGEIKSQWILNTTKMMGNRFNNNYPSNQGKAEIFSVRMFNLSESLQLQKRTYLLQFDEMRTSYVAAEIKIKNPNYLLEEALLLQNIGHDDDAMKIF